MFSYFVYGFIWFMSLLPLQVLYVFSDIIYYVLYYVVGYRRKVVRTNLVNSFPDKDAAWIRSVEKKFYRHLSDMFVELYKTWHISSAEIKRRFVFKNPEVFENYFKEGRSVIGVLGHYANWEWMTSFPLWTDTDFDLLALYKPLHDDVMNSMVKKIRSRYGALPVPKNDVLREIVEHRKNNRLFIAAFIGDQTPNRSQLHYWMKFLNQDTPVLIGTEKVARKYNLPVVSLMVRQLKRGYYEVEFIEICSHPAELPVGELTEMHSRLLESEIRERPELWLWSHRRWKHKRYVADI
ncbi:MAG: lysophospholipid acyltransferase family protein [Culturomica sp.]|jgi:KDO2-lipid IV(A) lauroyltransferase|nr:lysophospholipid acyltransferase family protein [Culturomica sp.]